MKKRYLIIGLIFFYSCDSNKLDNNKRTQDFILKIKDNFNTNDIFIKIINGSMSMPEEDNTILISRDTSYWMWARHNQFGENGNFSFGHIMTNKINNYDFDSAMYRWSIDTTSLLVTFFNSLSDSSITYIYTTHDHGDGSYSNSTNELIW